MGSQKCTLCSVSIVSNNNVYNYRLCLISNYNYWTLRYLAKVHMKTCLSGICDVTTSINSSHESIDITPVGLDKAKAGVKLL